MLTSLDQRSRHAMTLQTGHRSTAALWESLRKYSDTLREAFAAYREYHRLIANRIPHEEALRQVFGLEQVHQCYWTENWRKSWTTKRI